MTKICYVPWSPQGDTLRTVQQANDICATYAVQGYDLTLRQLYYQFVARGLIPNQDKSYKRLGEVVNNARLAGLMDWSYITDRTRSLASLQHWEHPREIVEDAAQDWRVDHWADQDVRVEVWVEKEALAGIVARAAQRWDCPWFACRGYVSQSEMWAAAQRVGRHIENGQPVLVLHLGDHDPSGLDMTRDMTERMRMFLLQDYLNMHRQMCGAVSSREVSKDMDARCGGRQHFELRRIALNMDQVQQYDPPPNPAKVTDSRAAEYIARYGEYSWELDALDPAQLNNLITDSIKAEIDTDRWDAMLKQQGRKRKALKAVSQRWDEVAAFLGV